MSDNWYRGPSGKISTMRIIAMLASFTGAFLAVAGVGLGVVGVVSKWDQILTLATVAIPSGCGLFSVALYQKQKQQSNENA
jgi:hypothetical protein